MQSHHALFLRFRNKDDIHVDELLRTHYGVELKGNPDVHIFTRDVFTIEDSRSLALRASMAPYNAENILVCICTDISEEAQQALLKLFEEPHAQTRFLLLVHRSLRVLPTLLSRVETLSDSGAALGTQSTIHAKEFLQKSAGERVQYVTSLAKSATPAELDELLDGIERTFYEEGGATGALREVLFVRSRIHARGASKKQLLEHLALSLG